MTSPASLRFQALHVFEQSLVGHVRTTMKARFPRTWLPELKSVFGPEKWARLSEFARQSHAHALDPGEHDEFTRLGIADFPELFDRHCQILAPNLNRGALHREINRIRAERNATMHPRGNDPTVAEAVELMSVMRRVLRALKLHDGMQQIDQLIDMAFRLGQGTSLAPKSASESAITPETFDRMFDMSEPELFIAPLMRFFQDVADNLYFGSEDEHHPIEERWGWHRGAETVALALQDILANGITMAGYSGLVRDAVRGIEDPPEEPPVDPPTPT